MTMWRSALLITATVCTACGQTLSPPSKVCTQMKDVFLMPKRTEIHGRPRALPNLGGCTEIRLEAMRLGWEEMEDNEIGSKGAALLAGALAKNTVLRHLDLSHNHKAKITNEGAAALAEMLKVNTALTSVE